MKDNNEIKVRRSRFPMSMMWIYYGVMLLTAGIHTGLIVLMNKLEMNSFVQSIIPMLYWLTVATILAAYIRRVTKKTYENPIQDLANAASKVAGGDFSVYVPPLHTPDKTDYLDVLIMDFNRMVEALGSTETLKTDFLSNVSHEIKTPIAVIQNTAELLKNDSLPPEIRTEYIDTILRSTRKLSALITNILKLNKLEKQTITPDKTRYNLCEQLTECALQFEHIWENKNIEFEVNIEEKAYIFADSGLMETVWNNLLSNALKFTPNGGRVTLRQETRGNEIIVTFSDTGCGMSAETLTHIFDKFYQGDTSRSTDGNGLGLALVKRVLQLMDMEITAESKPEKGSEFTVIIPRKEMI